MGFGSDQFFYKLKQEVEKKDGDGSVYFLLNQEVKKVVYPIISNKIPMEYVEDVYQDVFFSVWKNIASYIINMEKKTECQRLAWLITVTKRRIADFYMKIKEIDSETIYIDDVGYEIVSDDKSSCDDNEFTLKMKNVLINLFSVSTSPEKIISFVYSKIILSIETTSGKPSEASNMLKGMKLYEIFDMMKNDLEKCLQVKIPDSVYEPLVEKLEIICCLAH